MSVPVKIQQFINDDAVGDNKSGRLLPIQVFVVLLFLIFVLWWFLDVQRDQSRHDLIKDKSHKFSSYINSDIRSRVPSLQRMVSRWEQRGGTSKKEFLSDANAYINDLPGFQALERVDKNYHVRWVVPLKGNEEAQGLDLASETTRRVALETARNDKSPTVSAVVDLVQGGKGILIYFPLVVENEFDGFILAVFKVDKWLDYVFGSSLDLEDEQAFYNVAVSIDHVPVYKQAGWRDDTDNDWYKEEEIFFLGRIVSIVVQPTGGFFENEKNYYPEIVGLSGLLLSFLVAVMIYLLQKTNVAVQMSRNINLSLETNVEERRRAEQDAHRANMAKSDFLSSMSHELRTPLNAILGFGQLLQMDKNLGGSSRYVAEILTAGGHLLNLIEDILDFSKIETGHMDMSIEEISLNQVLGECLVLIEELARKQNITIINQVSDDNRFCIASDYTRFKQALLNLLTNAIKYNRKEGNVTIKAEITQLNRVRISVIDTGEGLSEAQQEKLFQPFERIGAEASGIEGTGIGLVISKRLIELMGGNIGIDSKLGKGSTFWLEVNLAGYENKPVEKLADFAKEAVKAHGTQVTPDKTILYIEDNPANLRLLEDVIDMYTSYRLITALDANKGLKLAEKKLPDLILLDINLPGMDGFEVMKRLQGSEKTRHIPVIAVSARAMKRDLKRGALAGFKSYVTKPIDIEDLLGKISEQFEA